MSVYNSPTENLTVFNPIDYLQNYQLLGGAVTGGGTSLDLAYLQANFLEFPKSQGGETFIADITGVNGSFSGGVSGTTMTAPTVLTSKVKTSSGSGALELGEANTTTTTVIVNGGMTIASDLTMGGGDFSNSQGTSDLGVATATSLNQPSYASNTPLYIGTVGGNLNAINKVQVGEYLFTNTSLNPYTLGTPISNAKSTSQQTLPVAIDKQLFLNGTSVSQYLPTTDDNYLEIVNDINGAGAVITQASSENAGLSFDYVNTALESPTRANQLTIVSNGVQMTGGIQFPFGALSAGGFNIEVNRFTSNDTVTFGGNVLTYQINFASTYLPTFQPVITMMAIINHTTSPLPIGLQFAVDSYVQNGSGYYTGFIFNVCNVRSGEGNTGGQTWGCDWTIIGQIQ